MCAIPSFNRWLGLFCMYQVLLCVCWGKRLRGYSCTVAIAVPQLPSRARTVRVFPVQDTVRIPRQQPPSGSMCIMLLVFVCSLPLWQHSCSTGGSCTCGTRTALRVGLQFVLTVVGDHLYGITYLFRGIPSVNMTHDPPVIIRRQ